VLVLQEKKYYARNTWTGGLFILRIEMGFNIRHSGGGKFLMEKYCVNAKYR